MASPGSLDAREGWGHGKGRRAARLPDSRRPRGSAAEPRHLSLSACPRAVPGGGGGGGAGGSAGNPGPGAPELCSQLCPLPVRPPASRCGSEPPTRLTSSLFVHLSARPPSVPPPAHSPMAHSPSRPPASWSSSCRSDGLPSVHPPVCPPTQLFITHRVILSPLHGHPPTFRLSTCPPGCPPFTGDAAGAPGKKGDRTCRCRCRTHQRPWSNG